MFKGSSPKSTANVPVTNDFRTPKPKSYGSHINARDRESGQSYASQESITSANSSAAHFDPSKHLFRPDDLQRTVPLPLRTTSVEPTQRPGGHNRGYEAPVSSQNFSSGPNQTSQGSTCYSNSTRQFLRSNNDAPSENFRTRPEGSSAEDREGFQACPVPLGYSVACGQTSHNSLTDADKLQQFNSLGRRPHDRFVHWSPSVAQMSAFDVGQNQLVSGHLISSRHLLLERDDRPLEYCMMGSVQRGHHGSAYDLTAWLQNHKQNLRQQQNDPVCKNQLSSRGHHASTGNLVDNSSEKVEILKQAADDIISAKDSIIERQKARIIQLEQNAVKSKYCTVFGSEHGPSNEQILERKLGAVEYELQELQRSSENALHDKETVIARLKEELKEKDSTINDCNTKYSTQKSELDHLQDEISRHNRYLAELPTAEEHSNNLSIIKSLQEENLSYKDMMIELKENLNQLTSDLQTKDSCVKFLEDSIRELNAKLQDSKASNRDLTEKLSVRVDLLELQQLQKENRRLGMELEKAGKLMDALNNQTKQQALRHKAETSSLTGRLEQQASAAASFQQQIGDKEQMLQSCHQSVKELTAENQNLLERTTKLEEELKDLRQPERVEELKLQQLLFKELSISFSDMNRVIKVALQKVNGQEPNLALLLGIRDCSVSDEIDAITRSSAALSLGSLKAQLSLARTLRHDVDKLREIVADKFAEDMGRRLTCTPQ